MVSVVVAVAAALLLVMLAVVVIAVDMVYELVYTSKQEEEASLTAV